ncbi:hypothetical protein [Blastococcus sp. PRF04-17]|uniref:hypothetical protein n=1 Tax=Blastococcus sp. PRF04-17 TaxID=2933797 RepID=UPI001FF1649B|nr:hypothetical protein [Blastococcus sp. PRF04-17]UOX99722.1 hypothetical protein MVA48_11715 [Blastococcus sp. PRF04-17]
MAAHQPEAEQPAPEPPVIAQPTPSPFHDLFAGAPEVRSLATVTRLPVVPLEPAPDSLGSSDELFPEEPAAASPPPAVDVVPVREEAVDAVLPAQDEISGRLAALGLPAHLLGASFADEVGEQGVYAALTRALSMRLPKAPALPTGAGEVLFVVGPGIETLRAAQSLAASLRLDPDRVQWATRGDLAGLAPVSSRVTTTAAAIERQKDAAAAGTVTIVAVDAPLRTDAFWTAQMMSIWSPVAVWAVVEATRKPEDIEPWLDGLPQVDALIVQDTDLSADPAAVLRRVDEPVALLDGARATAHRWASLLCERLESAQA